MKLHWTKTVFHFDLPTSYSTELSLVKRRSRSLFCSWRPAALASSWIDIIEKIFWCHKKYSLGLLHYYQPLYPTLQGLKPSSFHWPQLQPIDLIWNLAGTLIDVRDSYYSHPKKIVFMYLLVLFWFLFNELKSIIPVSYPDFSPNV